MTELFSKKFLYPAFLFLAVFSGSTLLYSFQLLDSWQDKLFDRFFVRSEVSAPVVIIAIDNESISKLGAWPWDRATFARALSELKDARVVGIDVNFSEPSRFGEADDRALAKALEMLEESTEVILPVQLDERGKVVATPLSALPATGVGYVNFASDLDGIVRHADTARSEFESFAAVVARGDAPASGIPERFRISYAGPARTFLTIPFIDVVNKTVPQSVINDKIVLIGATAPDLHDFVNTPFGALAGVEVHANAVNTIISGRFFTETPFAATTALLFVIDALAILLVYRLRRLWSLLAALLACFAFINIASVALFSYQLLVPVLYLNVSFVAASGLAILLQYVSESKQKNEIRKAFQYYLTPDVINELLEHPEKLALGGEKRTMTILFSDIAGFTTVSEKLSPTELTTVMNEYLTAMTDIITDHHGVVDKYIGDAIMAFWGAPLGNAQQAQDACRAAHAMTERLAALREMWKERGIPEIHARIGIATGEVVVGNMGSATRFNYTVMGDEVNFASRLEGLCKVYGVPCLVSKSTMEAARRDEGLRFRPLDTVRVKGKHEAREIFELLSREEYERRHDALALFSKGYDSYKQGRWQEAREFFTQVLRIEEDGPTTELLRRTKGYLDAPPAHWDGVHTFDTK